MKPITLHPLSVIVGCALAGLSVLLVSAAQSPGSVHSIPTTEVRLVGEIPAGWWTYVKLVPPQTFTVPTDRSFVVTEVGFLDPATSVFADGQDVGEILNGVSNYSNGGTQAGNGTRVAFPPGTLLTYNGGNSIQLWGYLEPVR